ncbi:MAG TPA: cupin domain-containing protein [Candidatus Babeliales bacterium]|nr:cupin domain-containing protein [Candidatus Babeliales bacterium]
MKQEDGVTIYKTGPVYFATASAGKVLADHTHKDAETLWIISGEGKIEIGSNTTEFKGPCVINIPSDQYHKFLAKTEVKFIYKYE